MKSTLSFFLVVLLATLLSFSNAQNNSNNCPEALSRLNPCLGQIHGSLLGRRQRLIDPIINSSCCAAVIDAVGDCSTGQFRSLWLSKAHKICAATENNNNNNNNNDDDEWAESIPLPPLLPPTPSPPDGCDLNRMSGSCTMELLDFGNKRRSTISKGCCATAIDVQDKCGPAHSWADFFLQCLDYCHNHDH